MAVGMQARGTLQLSSCNRNKSRRSHCITRMPPCQAFKGAGSLGKDIKVVGMGSCGVDYLASVAAYPRPDEKLRTEQLEVQGGGNAANALTAAARLGLKPTLVTKIGGDGLGDGIITELKADGIAVDHVMRATGHPSPFTYIIVDRSGGTRTCIHTPGAALSPDEMTPALLANVLKDAALVYFDGRLTEAALLLARAARKAHVPVLVEAERLRPGLDELLTLADYVVTSAHFPQDWTGEAALEDALLSTALRLPTARFIITTLGTRGSILLERADVASGTVQQAHVQGLGDVMQQLSKQLDAAQAAEANSVPDCVTRTGLTIRRGQVASTCAPVSLAYSSLQRDASAAAASALSAAQRAAALNADARNVQGYSMAGTTTAAATHQAVTLLATVTMASIAQLNKEHVVDTTGAGDAFIGSVLYGLATGMSHQSMLQLAGLVAAAKCTQLGARPGLPAREHLAPHML